MRRPSSPAIRTSSKPCTTVLHARQLHRSLCRAVCCGCDEPSSSIRHPGRTLDETFDALDVSAIRSGSAVAPPRDRLATFRSHAEGAEFRSRGQEGPSASRGIEFERESAQRTSATRRTAGKRTCPAVCARRCGGGDVRSRARVAFAARGRTAIAR